MIWPQQEARLMNNELEWMCKLAAVAQVEVLFWYLNAKT
jgi:hypothetical protein